MKVKVDHKSSMAGGWWDSVTLFKILLNRHGRLLRIILKRNKAKFLATI